MNDFRLVRVTVPVCLPAILDISIYLFVNAMTTVSAVVFLYSSDTTLASVAVLNMDDAGDVAPAAAMGMMIVCTSVAVRMLHALLTRGLNRRTQAWRTRKPAFRKIPLPMYEKLSSLRPEPDSACPSRLRRREGRSATNLGSRKTA